LPLFPPMNTRIFDKHATNACKGVALLLLLWHHLFFQCPEYGFVVYKTAIIAKVCLAMFVILSGYGFSESVRLKKTEFFQFYKNRLIAIYSNYWFIALLFVPIGVFFMGRTLQSAFTDHCYVKFLIQMTGLHRFVYSEYGYNATWWYMSVIIPLIILFPLFHYAVKKYGVFALLFLFALLIPGKPIIPVLNEWLFPFALGIYVSQRNCISAISAYLNALGWTRYFLLSGVIIFIAVLRIYFPSLHITKINWLFGLAIILLIFELSMTFQIIGPALSFLGKHLFNVFLFHSFIYCYYWKDFIYSFKQPVLIFLVLLFLCVGVSIVLEYVKKVIGFHSLIQKIRRLGAPGTV
jgi:hypothetical protein